MCGCVNVKTCQLYMNPYYHLRGNISPRFLCVYFFKCSSKLTFENALFQIISIRLVVHYSPTTTSKDISSKCLVILKMTKQSWRDASSVLHAKRYQQQVGIQYNSVLSVSKGLGTSLCYTCMLYMYVICLLNM